MQMQSSLKTLLIALAILVFSSTGAFAADKEAEPNIADQEYNLTVSQLEKLYKQSTDGLPASNTGSFNPAVLYSQGPMITVGSLNLAQPLQQILAGGVPTQGLPLTDTSLKMQLLQLQQQLLSQISDPLRNIPSALASQLAVQTMLGNSFAQITTANANAAINFTGKYLINFTAQEGNVWNKLRNNIFVPIAILLLVPGAVLTQTKVMMSASNPVIESGNPFEGILRAVVAMCFIAGSYLIINYGIDFSNSISHTIQEFYKAQFGTDMYADAFKGQQRAFPSRQAAENKNSLSFLPGLAPMSPFPQGNDVTGLSGLENQLFNNKTFAADGTQQAIEGMADELMPSNEVVARLAVFGSNMAVTTIWDLLCTFQLIYLHYLFLVGPIMAAIWVYPIRQLREAWPNWVVGVVTLCFWSLFWNTAVLLMALFNNADATGTFIFTALNCLATGSVKFAFDFVGLITEAGHTAVSAARNHMAQNTQNQLMMPMQNGLAKPGETPMAMPASASTNALASTASILATEGLTNANAANALANQVMSNLGSISNGMQGATSTMKDWTNGLSMPPLVQSALNSLPVPQFAAIEKDLAKMTTLPSMIGTALPPLAAQVATASGNSKDFRSLMADPFAVLQKGAQAINMNPSTYDNVPVPGAEAQFANSLMNKLNNAAPAVQVAPAEKPTAGSGVMAAFQTAESTRKMEAEAKEATPSAPKNSSVDFLKAVTQERARQAALNGGQSDNGYPSWAKPI